MPDLPNDSVFETDSWVRPSWLGRFRYNYHPRFPINEQREIERAWIETARRILSKGPEAFQVTEPRSFGEFRAPRKAAGIELWWRFLEASAPAFGRAASAIGWGIEETRHKWLLLADEAGRTASIRLSLPKLYEQDKWHDLNEALFAPVGAKHGPGSIPISEAPGSKAESDYSHKQRVKAVERRYGGQGGDPYTRFYRPLRVTGPEFTAWKTADWKHCGKQKKRRIDDAADRLLAKL